MGANGRVLGTALEVCGGVPSRDDLLRVVSVCTVITILGVVAASAVCAQDTPPSIEQPAAPPQAPTPSEVAVPERLETVTVTARRRLENVQDAPLVMTALTADRIDRLNVRSIEELSTATPGLIVTRGSGGSGADFRLRGIGSTFTSVGIEQSVAVIVDGAYYGQGRMIDEGFDDLKRVEILKGPQALFFGKNSTAGVISITTEDPGTEFDLKARVGYEFRARERKGLFVASGPLSDTVGLRVVLSGRHMDKGYVRNEAAPGTYTTTDAATGVSTSHPVPAPGERDLPANRSLFGRLTATYAPRNHLKLTLKASAGTHRSGSSTWNDKLWKCPSGSTTSHPPTPCGNGFVVQQNPVPPDIAATRPDLNRYGGQLYSLYKSSALTARVDYEGEKYSLVSITNGQYMEHSEASDYDFTGAPFIYADGNTDHRAFSQELRLHTKWHAPVNYMLGMLYQRTKLNFTRTPLILGSENSAADPVHRYATYNQVSATRGETKVISGQVIWAARPGVEVAAGARYTDEAKRSFFVQPYVNPTVAGIYALNQRLESDQHFHNLSPEVSLRWKPREDVTTYAAWKAGYKSGGFSNSGIQSLLGSSIDTFTFKPEKVKGIEAGVKATLLDQRLHVNLAAYRYAYSDLQLEFFNTPTLVVITTNAGSATTNATGFRNRT